jgi:hypothetical protein
VPLWRATLSVDVMAVLIGWGIVWRARSDTAYRHSEFIVSNRSKRGALIGLLSTAIFLRNLNNLICDAVKLSPWLTKHP